VTTQPALFVLDNDASVLEILLQDLARRFGNDFAVMGDSSSAAALNTLESMVTGREMLDEPGVRWDGGSDPLPLETSMPGVFASGDVRQGSIKRVASAVGEGATVVRLVHEYLRTPELSAPLS
jgi:NADPH-dependent glutamate synthase beta subunit-like oxidoreductase